MQIPDYWLTFALATVLPALVALVTKQFASAAFKGVLLAALSAATGILTTIQANGGEFEWKTALTGFFIAFITAVVTHYGLLKPTGVTGSDGSIAAAVPGGIGSDAA